VERALDELVRTRRVIAVNVAGERRSIPVEYVGRYRDALGVPLPTGLPESLLLASATAATDLARRYARTHGPFTTDEFAARYGLGHATAHGLLKELSAGGRLLEGEFRPGGSGHEWCDPDILQTIRRRSLARLRKQVEPVEPHVFVRLLASWQGVARRRPGLDALLDTIELLQGVPLAATAFESEVLSARVESYQPADLDALCAAGEVVWRGVEPVGDRDGRIALYLTDHFARLANARTLGSAEAGNQSPTDRERAILAHLDSVGASFFATIHEAAGGGYPHETVDALWSLVWQGLVTNDTFHALRAFTRPPERRARKVKGGGRSFRSRRAAPPSAEGRWTLVAHRLGNSMPSATEWSAAVAQQLLSRYGVLTREVAGAEGIFGGFSAVYDVLKAMEDAGRIRRGYFVSEVGATQFALPAALELMRALRETPDEPETVVLSATDPANPYGTMLKWPERGSVEDGSPGDLAFSRPTRSVGSQVIFVNGFLAGYIPRGGRQLLSYVPDDEPQRSAIARPLSARLAAIARGEDGRAGLLISEINGIPAADHSIAPFLIDAGFHASAMGLMVRRRQIANPSSLIAHPGSESRIPIEDQRSAISDQ
jgi:ATP-dependent Lhr-like helicase